MKIAKFTVWGEPKGKGRPRFANVGKFVKTYTPEETVNFENLVKLEYMAQCRDIFFPKDVPLVLCVDYYLSIPKSESKKKRRQMEEGNILPTKKPDYDNVAKAITDSLNKIAYHDDAQIVYARVRKFYSERPRMEITIREWRKEDEGK